MPIWIGFCPTCQRSGQFRPLTRRVHLSKPSSPIVKGVELVKRSSRNWIWPDPVKTLLPNGVGLPCMIVVYGPPGSFKTSFAIQAASAWCAEKGESAIMFPFEMGLGVQLQDMVHRFEATKMHFRMVDTWPDVLSTIEPYRLVVVDSLQKSGVSADEWRSVTTDHDKTLILVSQVNSAGDVKGGMSASHEADVAIELLPGGKFIVRKNRSGMCSEGRWVEPVGSEVLS